MNGESTNTNLNIGSVAEIHVSRKGLNGLFNQDEFGKYLITEITHHINDVGRYKNTFKGLSADISVIPAPPIKSPTAVSQVGIVTENNDPEQIGRVKVQMLWQKNNQTTDWILGKTKTNEGIENYHQFIVADYNFNGLEDFAILNYEASNAGPQYAFFLQNNKKQFKKQDAFPLQGSFFPKIIDPENKTLTISGPVGCCKINTTIYHLKPDNQWKMISSVEKKM